MDNKSILREAENIIYGDREKTYGNPGANCERIAKIWELIFKVPITPKQVCLAMIGLKVARLMNDIDHKDSYVDICGYAALWERICNQEMKQEVNNVNAGIDLAVGIDKTVMPIYEKGRYRVDYNSDTMK